MKGKEGRSGLQLRWSKEPVIAWCTCNKQSDWGSLAFWYKERTTAIRDLRRRKWMEWAKVDTILLLIVSVVSECLLDHQMDCFFSCDIRRQTRRFNLTLQGFQQMIFILFFSSVLRSHCTLFICLIIPSLHFLHSLVFSPVWSPSFILIHQALIDKNRSNTFLMRLLSIFFLNKEKETQRRAVTWGADDTGYINTLMIWEGKNSRRWYEKKDVQKMGWWGRKSFPKSS